MIQKRFEYWSGQGKTWSDWFNYCFNNNQLEIIQCEEQWQSKHYKLRNEFRVV